MTAVKHGAATFSPSSPRRRCLPCTQRCQVLPAALLDAVEVDERLLDVAPALRELGTAYVDLLEQVLQLAGLTRLFVVHVDDGGDLVEGEPEPAPAQDQLDADPVAAVEHPGRAAALGG